MTRKTGHTNNNETGQENTLNARQRAFCELFKELSGDLKKLSEKLGQPYDTVYKRCHRLGLTKKIEKSTRAAGKTMAVIDQAIKKAKARKKKTPKRNISTAAVENLPIKKSVIDGGSDARAKGFIEGQQSFDIFESLEQEYRRVQSLTEWLEQDLRQQKASGKKITGYHIDIACKLVRESRTTVTELHKIRQEQYNVHGTKLFMEAVTSLLMEELPHVQERLYIKLARLGASPSASFAHADKQSDAEFGTDRISDADIGEELPE